MAAIKTVRTEQNVRGFLGAVEPEERRADSLALVDMMQKATGETPAMWGTSIVGFGSYRYATGKGKQEAEWPLIGFSPREQNLTLYLMGAAKENGALLEKLGKHKLGGGCLYINRLADVDRTVLGELLKAAFAQTKKEKGA
jgi:hypothetical protein